MAALAWTAHVYRIEYLLNGETKRRVSILADNVNDAGMKLANRFSVERDKFRFISVKEVHGKFIVGSEERDL